MTKVLKHTQEKYRYVIMLEFILLIIFFCVTWFFQQKMAIAFLLGASAVFIPQLFFIVWMFFFRPTHSVKRFYLGESIKFTLTVLFLVLILGRNNDSFFALGLGYIFTLVLNNILPFMVEKYHKISI